jgi:hypothetical protein
MRITSTGPSVIMKLRASAPHLGDRHFQRQAHRAVDLHAAVGDAEAELGAGDLGHEALVPRERAGVGAQRGAIDQKLRHRVLGDAVI